MGPAVWPTRAPGIAGMGICLVPALSEVVGWLEGGEVGGSYRGGPMMGFAFLSFVRFRRRESPLEDFSFSGFVLSMIAVVIR